MVFEWDENKNRINKAKHGVSFDAAKMVFFALFASSDLTGLKMVKTVGTQ